MVYIWKVFMHKVLKIYGRTHHIRLVVWNIIYCVLYNRRCSGCSNQRNLSLELSPGQGMDWETASATTSSPGIYCWLPSQKRLLRWQRGTEQNLKENILEQNRNTKHNSKGDTTTLCSPGTTICTRAVKIKNNKTNCWKQKFNIRFTNAFPH